MTATEERNTRDLEQRLAEAEATIAALLSGQIDAVLDAKISTPLLLGKAQAALRESEERLRRERDRAQRYLDTAEVILLKLNTEGQIILVNRCACSILGWTANDLLGRDWVETCVPARRRVEVRRRLQNILAGDSSVAENLILTRSGSERVIEWRSRLLHDDDGNVTGMLSSGADITERHKAAEAMRIAEERTQFALKSAGVGIWDLDLSTGTTHWSEILEFQYGLQPGAFGGTFDAFLDRIHPDDRASALETFGTAMKSGLDFSLQNRTIWPDGTVRWLLNVGRFRYEAGVPVRGVGISQDVTARIQTERDLKATTAHLVERTRVLEEQATVLKEQAVLLDLAPDAIVICDMQGRVVFWNQGAEVLYGWRSDEALGRGKKELLKADFSAPVDAEFPRSGPCNGEANHTTRSGKELIVASRWTIQCDANEVPVRILTISRDITARKQAEAELLRAKDAAEAANRVKSQFLANMSHEIRTPMNGILGMTELVLDTVLTPDQRENLGIAKTSALDLLAIIDDILDLSRIEAHRLQLDPIDFNPRDLVAETAKALALRVHQKGLELIVDVGPGVPRMVRGDPGRLRQVLVNLIGNAIKFTMHGEIVVHVTSVQAASHGDLGLHFSVNDTGIGIPADRQGSIFEAFTQADGSTTRKYGGTGLGLTISSQLVQLMGGQLLVESAIGRGSTFHFNAHFKAVNAESATPEAAPEGAGLRGISVLVVDDNIASQRLLKQIFLGWGMFPILTASVTEALSALRLAQESGRAIPLVVTDFQLPDADAFVLAETIRKDPALAAATVVLLTSAGRRGDADRCREFGIGAYLTKPILESELRSAIHLALDPKADVLHGSTLVTRHSVKEVGKAGLILVVEDNPVNQLVASRLLERHGYTIVVANNGQEALDILNDAASGQFDCVLMDIQMPVMGGFECTLHIRDKEKTTGYHIPIIAMTAHAMEGDSGRCLAAGMDAYLSKPLDRDSFIDTVERHVRLLDIPRQAAIPARECA
jgi:two-component system sensor histidine kinase/response regulator